MVTIHKGFEIYEMPLFTSTVYVVVLGGAAYATETIAEAEVIIDEHITAQHLLWELTHGVMVGATEADEFWAMAIICGILGETTMPEVAP